MALGVVTVAAIWLVQGASALLNLPIVLYNAATNFPLLAIPLFILAAEFMNAGSIMDRLVRFCNALVGRFRGGLALVNVAQSIIFASMSGSALADAAGGGKLMQSLMTREGKYTRAFAAALTAVADRDHDGAVGLHVLEALELVSR